MAEKQRKKIRLLLVDDHAMVRSGIRLILANEDDIDIVGEAESGKEALEIARSEALDVVLMDIGLSDMSGIEATQKILEQLPSVKVIALTMYEDEEYFFKMLDAGASGYVPKRAAPEELITAIRAADRNEVFIYPSLAKYLVRDHLQRSVDKAAPNLLTKREQEVLSLLAEGFSNQEIGEELSISPKTVGRHRENIMRKLKLHNRTELVKFAIRKGIISA